MRRDPFLRRGQSVVVAGVARADGQCLGRRVVVAREHGGAVDGRAGRGGAVGLELVRVRVVADRREAERLGLVAELREAVARGAAGVGDERVEGRAAGLQGRLGLGPGVRGRARVRRRRRGLGRLLLRGLLRAVPGALEEAPHLLREGVDVRGGRGRAVRRRGHDVVVAAPLERRLRGGPQLLDGGPLVREALLGRLDELLLDAQLLLLVLRRLVDAHGLVLLLDVAPEARFFFVQRADLGLEVLGVHGRLVARDLLLGGVVLRPRRGHGVLRRGPQALQRVVARGDALF